MKDMRKKNWEQIELAGSIRKELITRRQSRVKSALKVHQGQSAASLRQYWDRMLKDLIERRATNHDNFGIYTLYQR